MKYFILMLPLAFMGCASLEKPFYYSVEKDGRQAYVLGTGHYGWDMTRLPKRVLKDFEAAPVLEMEREDFFIPNEDRKKRQWKEEGDWIKRETLRNAKTNNLTSFRFTPVGWNYVLEKIGKDYGHEELDTFPPLLISGFIEKKDPTRVFFKDYKMWYRYKFERMDKQFGEVAVKMNKPRLSLDDERVLTMECEDELGRLNVELRARGHDEAVQFESFYEAYTSGDEEKMQEYSVSGSSPYADQCMLHDRNLKWVDRFIGHFNKYDKMFTIVGVGHLVGPKNLFEYLRGKGFLVRRIEDFEE